MSAPPVALVTQLVENCPLDEPQTQRIVAKALEYGGRAGLRVGVVFAADDLMVEVHGEFLDDPTPTDVITFDLGAPEFPAGEEEVVAAELYVGVEEAERVAAERGVAWERELALYVVHGVLHLCGLDDHSEADSAAMRVGERAVMDALGYPPDELPHHM